MENCLKGNLGFILKTIASGLIRSTSRLVDDTLALQDAQQLYDAGAEENSSNENKFINIICFRSLPHLNVTLEYYYKIASIPLDKSIEKEMSGKIKYALLAIIKSNENLAKFFAEKLNLAIKQRNQNDISRIIISRSEVLRVNFLS